MGLLARISSLPIAERARQRVRSWVLADESYTGDFGRVPPTEAASPALAQHLRTSTAVFAAATLRAELLADLHLCTFKGEGGRRRKVERGHAHRLLRHVNPFWTQNRLLQMTSLSMGVWGAAIWFLECAENGGRPREIWWARSDRVHVVDDAETYVRAFVYYPQNGARPLVFSPEETVWMPTANPLDEFAGLSSIKPAELSLAAADSARTANKNLHDQGLTIGGYLTPGDNRTWTKEQASELKLIINKRFSGQDNKHRWGVFRHDVNAVDVGHMTPRDAEFTDQLKLTREEVYEAFKLNVNLLTSPQNRESLEAAMGAAYHLCVLPHAAFIAAEISEKLIKPHFRGEADSAEFTHDHIAALQADKKSAWDIEEGQLAAGAITINEWRESRGMKSVEWGDVPRASSKPVSKHIVEDELPSSARSHARAAIEYGSERHRLLDRKFRRSVDGESRELARVLAELLRSQRDSVLSRSADEVIDDPFELSVWIRRFQDRIRPIMRQIIANAGANALDDLALIEKTFSVFEPAVIEFMERSTQKFAQRVNDTTWRMLKEKLATQVAEGATNAAIEDAIKDVMGKRIASSAETIARTETARALNGGTLEAWKQSGVVEKKEWLATLDGRLRDTHRDAHGQQRDLDSDFDVGRCSGPAPGQTDCAHEDINCRCSMVAVLG